MTIKKLIALSAILGATALAACSYAQTTDAPNASVPASVETIAVVSSGTFSGRSDHITVGGVSIVGTTGNYQLVFAENFSLDGAPDPVVGFGNSGNYDANSQIAPLTNKDGAQSYALPTDFDPATFDEVYVWCERFSVPLGVATLNQ